MINLIAVILFGLVGMAMFGAVAASIWAHRSIRAESALFAKERSAMEDELSAMMARPQRDEETVEA